MIRTNWYSALDLFTSSNFLVKCTSVVAIGASLLALRILLKTLKQTALKYPPQIYGLPIFGSLFTKIFWEEQLIHEILPSYGDIVLYNIGFNKQICINNVNLINAIFNKIDNRHPTMAKMFKSYKIEPPVSVINNNLNDPQNQTFRRNAILNNLNLLTTKLCV